MAAYMNTAYTGLTPSEILQRHLSHTSELKNISNIIIRDDNNSIHINMLSSNRNIISNVHLNHHKYY